MYPEDSYSSPLPPVLLYPHHQHLSLDRLQGPPGSSPCSTTVSWSLLSTRSHDIYVWSCQVLLLLLQGPVWADPGLRHWSLCLPLFLQIIVLQPSWPLGVSRCPVFSCFSTSVLAPHAVCLPRCLLDPLPRFIPLPWHFHIKYYLLPPFFSCPIPDQVKSIFIASMHQPLSRI